ncbi:MAG: FMN-binding protein [Xanthomonadales bacterium]|nr:FMN-binding protein [Xanthomonadales bacterium]
MPVAGPAKRRVQRRDVLAALGAGPLLWFCPPLRAETFLSADEARELIFPGGQFVPTEVTLSKDQAARIKSLSGVRVRNLTMQAWRSSQGEWLVVDQVIGKHEFIDIAVGYDAQGRVAGVEVLTYRESYGAEIRHPKWRAQFHGRDHSQRLELDEQIHNISGATLSCQHVTQGVNRLNATWAEVLSKR